MSTTDACAFVGPFPFRALPHGDVDWMLGQMDRVGIDRAWVGYLAACLHKDPAFANVELFNLVAPHEDRLFAVPTVDPSLPGVTEAVQLAADTGARAMRVYPMHVGIDPAGPVMSTLIDVAASLHLPLILTVRFEDVRQRHPMDVAADLPAAAVRSLARMHSDARILVTQADRAFIEEVHFGLTPEEAGRLLWDISWIWGPPEDHLTHLFETVGVERFTFGTGMPLRIPDASVAKLDLMELSPDLRSRIMGENLEAWSTRHP